MCSYVNKIQRMPSSVFFFILSFGQNFAFKVIAANNINNHNRYYSDGIVDNSNNNNSSVTQKTANWRIIFDELHVLFNHIIIIASCHNVVQ